MPDEQRMMLLDTDRSAFATFTSHAQPVAHFQNVYGTKNTARLDFEIGTITLAVHGGPPRRIRASQPHVRPGLAVLSSRHAERHAICRSEYHTLAGLNFLIDAFYESIRQDGPVPVPYRDMLKVAAMTEAVFATARRPFTRRMTVLVTGSTGFLGTAVVERLLAHGVRRIRCFARPSSNTARLTTLASAYQHPVEVTVGNLQSVADIERALVGVDTVYHLAGGMRGAPAGIFLDTVVASKRLVEAIRIVSRQTIGSRQLVERLRARRRAGRSARRRIHQARAAS
jgi:hypothetical protein